MARQGTRDGSFIVFKDTDINRFDIAYYPKLKKNTAQLKAVALAQPGFYVYAFNTNGWVKSLADMDWTKFITVKGCDLYVRVEFPGFYFAQRKLHLLNRQCPFYSLPMSYRAGLYR